MILNTVCIETAKFLVSRVPGRQAAGPRTLCISLHSSLLIYNSDFPQSTPLPRGKTSLILIIKPRSFKRLLLLPHPQQLGLKINLKEKSLTLKARKLLRFHLFQCFHFTDKAQKGREKTKGWDLTSSHDKKKNLVPAYGDGC